MICCCHCVCASLAGWPNSPRSASCFEHLLTAPAAPVQHVMENCFYWRDPAHSARAGLHDLLRGSLRRIGIREVSLRTSLQHPEHVP